MCVLHSVQRTERHARYTLALRHLQAHQSCLSARWGNCDLRARFSRNFSQPHSRFWNMWHSCNWSQYITSRAEVNKTSGYQGDHIQTLTSQPASQGDTQKGNKSNHRTRIMRTPGHCRKDLAGCEWDEVSWKSDVAIFKYLKSFNTCTVSSAKPLLRTQFGESSSYKWQFILPEPKRVLEKQWKWKIQGWWVELLAVATFTGIKREGRGCEVYTEDGKEVTGWQILSQYKGIKNTRFVVRNTKGSASPLNSEADCSSVSWERE